MANTAISTISTDIVRKGLPLVRWATLAANTYIPGDWVYYSATGTATALATGTAACKLLQPKLMNFVPRLNTSTKARLDVDDSYSDQTTARCDLIWAPETPYLLVAATVEDPAGAALKGVLFMGSNTAGDIEILNSGTDPTSVVIQGLELWEDLANGDTVGIFLMR